MITYHNFSTGVLSGLPSGWQSTPVQVDVTTTSSLFYSYDIAVSEASYAGTQSFTNLGNPEGRISFGNDIQSDNFVQGSAGWRIERDTGNAEFSNVLVRGNSVTESSTIGGDAIVQWSLINEDNTLGGLIDSNAGVGLGIETQTAFVEFLRFAVEDDGPLTFQGGAMSFEGRLTTGDGNGAAKAAFTNSDITIEFQWQFLNDANSILGSTVQSITIDYDDIAYDSILDELTQQIPDGDLNDLTPSVGTTQVVLSIRWSQSVASNWGIGGVGNVSLVATNLIPKSSTASAYISSSDFNRFAGEVRGGRGLRIHRRLLFSGSETNLSNFGLLNADRDTPEKLEILVTWLDASATGTAFGFTSSLLSCVHPGQAAVDDTNTSGTSSPGIWLGNIYAGSTIFGATASGNDYVGSIWAANLGSTLALITGEDQASNISEARIRRVWSVYR